MMVVTSFLVVSDMAIAGPSISRIPLPARISHVTTGDASVEVPIIPDGLPSMRFKNFRGHLVWPVRDVSVVNEHDLIAQETFERGIVRCEPLGETPDDSRRQFLHHDLRRRLLFLPLFESVRRRRLTKVHHTVRVRLAFGPTQGLPNCSAQRLENKSQIETW